MSAVEIDSSLTPKIDFAALDTLFDLTGTRAFIPGGYGAIGEAIAKGMARFGASVAIALKGRSHRPGLPGGVFPGPERLSEAWRVSRLAGVVFRSLAKGRTARFAPGP